MNKISIIIPYHKKINYIKKTIKSVLNQTYHNKEIIIIYVDMDHSDLKKIKAIIKKKKNIKLIVNSKILGAGESRNKGAKIASGRYLAFIDSDDVWKKNKLKTQIEFMRKLKLKVSHTSYFIINEAGKITEKRQAKFVQTYSNLVKSCDIGLSTVIIEKKLFLKNKFSSNITKEDYAAWLKISKKIPIYGLDKYLVFWRKTKGSLSSNSYQKLCDAFDIYYRKENFSFFKSLFSIIVLSFNFFLKKYS